MSPTSTSRAAVVQAGPLDISVLGPLRVARDGDQLQLGGPKPQTVFALLVAAAGRSVSADALIDALWRDEPPASARATLQSHVSKLRAVLGDTVIWEGGAYRLDLDRGSVDAWRFEDAVSSAREMVAGDPSGAVRRLSEGLALWRGHPYSGLPECPPIEAEVRRLEETRLLAVEDRIEAGLALGNHGDLIAELETLTAENPLRERLHAHLMLALYRSGRQGEALRAYERLRETLVEELGIDPSTELRRLHERILHQDPALEPSVVRDAGTMALLSTDIEDSTPLWESDPEGMAQAITEHDRIITTAVEAAGGRVVARGGDAMDAVFTEVRQAVEAAACAQRALATGGEWGRSSPLRVRMAIDVGEVELRGELYHGPVLNRLRRILAAGHGGQVLLSSDAEPALADVDGVESIRIGEYRFKGLGRPQEVFQLAGPGLERDFPALRLDRSPVDRDAPFISVRGYELREVLGEGDFGVVYRAYQPSVGREIAVKVIRGEYANQPDFIRRFEAEARFIAQLEHPHIVGLHDFWREPDGAYLVMPYLRGGSLGEALRRGPWHVGPALWLLEQVGAALSYAHRNGVVHRDVKPANVLLDNDGNAYLSDFGIAARLSDDAGGLLTSSVPYVPPEELRGESLNPQSDIFSLGVLTFTLLTGVHPAGRGLPALSDARPDLPAQLSDVLRRATADLPSERYERVEDLLRAFRQALGADVVGVAGPDRTRGEAALVRNPYKGLRAFQDTDAGDFHGRETLIDELLQAVSRHPVVTVVGASGSGKSSVVRAGLVPALRAGGLPGSRGWLVAEMFPGSHPFEELEAALLRVAVANPGGLVDELRSDPRGLLRVVKRILPPDDSELVLVIDQFEELFSLVDDEVTRRSFLDGLEALVDDERGRVHVILTLRADFFDRPLDYPAFGEFVKAGLVPVTPPSEESLGLAISRPARGVGLDLEPGLVGEIIADVQDQPGGLPLLQYALTELFQRREEGQLTIAAYRATGGVVGALGRRSDELYGGLSPDAKEVARQLFMRLVTIDDETDDTRRRVSQNELEGLDVPAELLEAVLQQYASYRLITFDRDASTRVPTVEVAHEALIREWPKLRGWIDEQRQHLILHRRLQASLREWSDADEDPSYLLRGGRLEQAERWTGESGIALSRLEDRYLAASREHQDDEDATTRRRRARVVAGLATALLVVTTLASVAVWQWSSAADEARVSAAQALAASSLANLDSDPELSILLALEAVDTTFEVDGTVIREAEEALHAALKSSRLTSVVPGTGGLGASTDGTRFAVATEEGAAVYTVTGDLLFTLSGHEGIVVNVAFSPDDELIATAGEDATVRLWDAESGEQRGIIDGPEGWVGQPAFSPDGTLLATSGEDPVVRIWDIETGEEAMSLPGHDGVVLSPSFSPDGTRLATASSDRTVRIWDLETGEDTLSLTGFEFGINRVVFSPDGARLATTGDDATPRIWDAETGELLLAFHGHTSGTNTVEFSPDGGRIATGGWDSSVRVWDARSGEQLLVLRGHTDDIDNVAFASGGDLLISTGLGGTARVWDISAGGSRNWVTVPAPWRRFADVVFSPDGSLFAVPEQQSGVRLYDTRTGEPVRVLGGHGAMVVHMAFSPDGSRLAAVAGSGFAPDDVANHEVPVWDVGSGELLGAFTGHEKELAAVGFSHDGRRVVSGGDGGVAKVWEVESWEEIRSFGVGDAVLAAQFSPDGRFLAVSGDRGGVDLFDAYSLEPAGVLGEEGTPGSLDLEFTADERLVATRWDGTLGVWDLRSREEITTTRQGGLRYLSAVSPDGSRIVTSGADGKVRFWDANTGADLLTLHPHDVLVFGADFSPDGRLLATVSADGTASLHVLDVDELRGLARDRLTRGLTDEECRKYLDEDRCEAA